MRRGVVISPSFEYNADGTLSAIAGGLPIKDITKYLLYFDDIDIPDNGFVSVELPPEIESLVHQGVIKRTKIGFSINEAGISSYLIPQGSNLPGIQGQGSFSFSDLGAFPIHAQLAAYTINNAQKNAIWSLAQLANAPYFPNATTSECLDIQLYDVLPIPREDIPFDKILEFKTKEQQSLEDLRGYLDELNIMVLSSSDKEKTISLCAQKISREVDNVINRMRNKKIRYYLGHFGFIFFSTAALLLSAGCSEPFLYKFATAAGSAGIGLVATKALQASEIVNQPANQAQLVYLNRARQAKIM